MVWYFKRTHSGIYYHGLPRCIINRSCWAAAAGVEPADIPLFYPIGTPGKPDWCWAQSVERIRKNIIVRGSVGQTWQNQTQQQRFARAISTICCQKQSMGGRQTNCTCHWWCTWLRNVWRTGFSLVLETQAAQVNIFVAPCISPWAYEHLKDGMLTWKIQIDHSRKEMKRKNRLL